MLAFEVRVNGKRVCIAGAEDLAVLSAGVSAVGTLGNKTVPARPDELDGDIFYSITGLTGREDPEKDVHMRWRSIERLKVGDIVEIRVLAAKKADQPRSRIRANKAR